MLKKIVCAVAFSGIFAAASLSSDNAQARIWGRTVVQQPVAVWQPQPVVYVQPQPVYVVQQPVIVQRPVVVRPYPYYVAPRVVRRPVYVW